MKKKWSKIWKAFNKWYDTNRDADWAGQKRQLTQLIRAEFPKANTRKLWAYSQNECDRLDEENRFPSWRQQQNIIKKAVAVQK